MIIHVIAQDFSTVGVTEKDIFGEKTRVGVGGSELALFTMCRAWHDRGDEVVLFNNPEAKNESAFEQRYIREFDPKEKRDVLIIFRSPHTYAIRSVGLKVWWSCDMFTNVPFAGFNSYVDKIVCLSPYHAKYFKDNYDIDNAIVIDLPIRIEEIQAVSEEKVNGRFIFSSVPERGLKLLYSVWKKLQKGFGDVISLVITSDYRLWGVSSPSNSLFIRKFFDFDNVVVLGALRRADYLRELAKSEIMAYPCVYPELFCISCAEAMVAGVYPVTSSFGALGTTNMGTVVDIPIEDDDFIPYFLDEVAFLLENRDILYERAKEARNKALARFSIQRILDEWDKRVFGGL